MSATPTAHDPLAVHVVVPARDEELLLAGHLVALARAVTELRRARPDVRVAATLVLDSCTDRSADLVRRTAAGWAWLDAVEVGLGSVGRARAAGVDRVRAAHHDLPPARVWVASTDADSAVPPEWLVRHAQVAADGAALLTGTVRPVGLSEDRLGRWLAAHQLGEGHEHVHGANLGFTLAAHDAVGGFAPLPTGEDVDLVARLRAAGVPWVASAVSPVLTSGRLVARAPEGFSEFVADL